MPRRLIEKKAEIYARRAQEWETRYARRRMAQQMIANGWGASHIIEVLEKVPVPHLDVNAAILDVPITDRVTTFALLRELNWPVDYSELLCIWYWSEAHWMMFVHEFQALPDVDCDYYYVYDAEIDIVRLAPMPSKLKRQVQLKYNSRTSQVQVG